MYGILQSTRVLGQEHGGPKKRLNAMVAFVFGFIAIMATNMLNVINIISAYFVLGLVATLMVTLLFGLVGAETNRKNPFVFWTAIAFFFLFILYGLATAGIIDLRRFVNIVFIPALLALGIGLALYFMFRKEPEGEKQAKKRKPPRSPEGPQPPELNLTPDQARKIERILKEG